MSTPRHARLKQTVERTDTAAGIVAVPAGVLASALSQIRTEDLQGTRADARLADARSPAESTSRTDHAGAPNPLATADTQD